MYFPVAGIEASAWIPFAAGFTVALFCSVGGLSGANLLLPFQMSVLGFVTPAVTSTNHIFNGAAIPSGVYHYIKEGRMVWPLTIVMICGTLPGVFIGVFFRVKYLADPSTFKVFAGFVLLYIGYMLVRSLLKRAVPGSEKSCSEKRFRELVGNSGKNRKRAGEPLPSVVLKHFGLKSIDYEFCGENVSAPTMGIFALSSFVGVVGGIYGIGGGAIIAPFFVAVFKMPVYTIAGACLMGTFITSVTAVVLYQLVAVFYPETGAGPDWMLGLLMGGGGMIGMYTGARVQKYIKAEYIKWMLAAILVFAGGRYILGWFF